MNNRSMSLPHFELDFSGGHIYFFTSSYRMHVILHDLDVVRERQLLLGRRCTP